MNHRISGPGGSASTARATPREAETTPRDDEPIFRMQEKPRSRVADRPATASGARAHPDGVPGPGQSREEMAERVAREARLTALRAGHALHLAALNVEGAARRVTGTYHEGIMNNPAGRPAGPTPPHVRIVLTYFDQVSGAVRAYPTDDPPPLELERLYRRAPVPTAVPVPPTVPMPSPPASSRLEPALVVQSRSPAEVEAMERAQAFQAMQAERQSSQPLQSLLPPFHQQIPLAPPPQQQQQFGSPAMSLNEQVLALPNVPGHPVGGLALPDVPGMSPPATPILTRH